MKTERMYKNWDKILTKKTCWKLNHTKTGAYENLDLTVLIYDNIPNSAKKKI